MGAHHLPAGALGEDRGDAAGDNDGGAGDGQGVDALVEEEGLEDEGCLCGCWAFGFNDGGGCVSPSMEIKQSQHAPKTMHAKRRTEEDVEVAHDDDAEGARDLHGVRLGHVRRVGEEPANLGCVSCMVETSIQVRPSPITIITRCTYPVR